MFPERSLTNPQLNLIAIADNLFKSIDKKVFKTFSRVFILCLFYNYCSAQNVSGNDLNHKKYNQIAYLCTHNAFNSKSDGFHLPNQQLSITDQLNLGVRALMIDVYSRKNDLYVYHAYKFLGSRLFSDVLQEIKIFLDDNPSEIVTLILESYASFNEIANAFEEVELTEYLYSKNPNEEWRTLEQLISENNRLVVFSDRNDSAENIFWYQYLWDNVVETNFSNRKIDDFSCEFNRGKENSRKKDLFILNHFITTRLLGTGSKRKSKVINSKEFLLQRAQNCTEATGKLPNFITVDYVNLGDCKEVVDLINTSNKNLN